MIHRAQTFINAEDEGRPLSDEGRGFQFRRRFEQTIQGSSLTSEVSVIANSCSRDRSPASVAEIPAQFHAFFVIPQTRFPPGCASAWQLPIAAHGADRLPARPDSERGAQRPAILCTTHGAALRRFRSLQSRRSPSLLPLSVLLRLNLLRIALPSALVLPQFAFSPSPSSSSAAAAIYLTFFNCRNLRVFRLLC